MSLLGLSQLPPDNQQGNSSVPPESCRISFSGFSIDVKMQWCLASWPVDIFLIRLENEPPMAVSCQLSQFSPSREPSSQLVRLLIDDVLRECLAKLASWEDIVGGIEVSVNSFSFQEVCRILILYVQCFKADNYKDDFQNLAPFSIILRLTNCGWRACRFKTHVHIADRSMALTNAN